MLDAEIGERKSGCGLFKNESKKRTGLTEVVIVISVFGFVIDFRISASKCLLWETIQDHKQVGI